MNNDDRKGYQWPASRITKSDMKTLAELKKRRGKPITHLLHEAVGKAYKTK